METTDRWHMTRHADGATTWAWTNDAGILVPGTVDLARSSRDGNGELVERAWVAADDGVEHLHVEHFALAEPIVFAPDHANAIADVLVEALHQGMRKAGVDVELAPFVLLGGVGAFGLGGGVARGGLHQAVRGVFAAIENRCRQKK